jgi:benzylsuccinate synthase
MALSARVKSFKKNHVPKHFMKDGYVKPVYLSIWRSRVFTKVWKETEGEPMSLRKAKALVEYLEKVPIFIRNDEILVGYHSESPSCLPSSIEAVDPDLIRKMAKDGLVKKEEAKEWAEICDYWDDKGLQKLLISRLTDKELTLAKADHAFMEVLPTQYTSRSQAEYDLVLENGFNGLKKMLNEKMAKLDRDQDACVGGTEAVEINNKMNDVKAMLLTVDGVMRWAGRYAALAKDMAKAEKDPQRKKELKEIAERCENVPANPARNYLEAIQSHWFSFLAAHVIEHLSHGTSLRLDQIFLKWYDQDVNEKKTLSREDALAGMEEFLLKIDELGRPLPAVWRKSLQGSNYLATYTIGGTKPEDGSDACNDMTVLICDALGELWINHPDFKFRWHPKVNPKAWEAVLDLQRRGLGQPSIKNEAVAIDTLINHYGFTEEEARSWAVVGCISPAPTLHWGRCRRDAWTVYPAKFLELTLFNGINPTTDQDIGLKTGESTGFKSFDEFFEAYRKQFAWGMRLSARIKSIAEDCNNQLCKRPLLSTMFRRSLESCRDIMDTPEKGMPWVNVPGAVDTCDSLISLKKLVFDDKKYKMEEVLKALKANWVGYEDMKQVFINAPKYGNNDDYADQVAKRTYTMFAEEMSKVKDINNASPMPSGLIITWMFSTADKVGALTNGRKCGDWLTDGGISPHAGYDKRGPMAAILSASKIDHRKQKAMIFNQKLMPSSVEGEAGMKKFNDYVSATMKLGLDMLQFNVVDAGTLKKAQEVPEKYPDLVVRISGYNANFVELDKFVQDAVISRTTHSL